MGFLPIFFLAFYLGTYLAIAIAGYAFSQGAKKYKHCGRIVFFATLAFGACSLAGCVAALLLIAILKLNVDFLNKIFLLYLTLVYSFSGAAGSWLFVWRVRKFVQWKKCQSANDEAIMQD